MERMEKSEDAKNAHTHTRLHNNTCTCSLNFVGILFNLFSKLNKRNRFFCIFLGIHGEREKNMPDRIQFQNYLYTR